MATYLYYLLSRHKIATFFISNVCCIDDVLQPKLKIDDLYLLSHQRCTFEICGTIDASKQHIK